MNMLDWINILSALSDQEKETLSYFCQEKYLKVWDVLFKEWEEATAMYILKTWAFEVTRIVNWEEVVLWKVRAEEMLWEMALFWDTNKRMATATCIKDSILITILSFSIVEMTSKNPDLLNKIRGIINERILSNKTKEQEGY